MWRNPIDPTECSNCDGQGHFTDWDDTCQCRQCNGTGRKHIDCPDCNGTGIDTQNMTAIEFMWCKRCGGDGIIPEFSEDE